MKEIRALAPYYVPELDVSEDKGAGIALIKIFANMQKLVIDRLNRVPDKNFAAFLDMLGIQLLPALPARVPVTFYLSKGAPENAMIPERTQIAAEEVVFETEKNMVATPSKLVNAYSISVYEDRIFASPSNIVKGELAFPFSSSLLFTAAEGDRKVVLREVSGLKKDDILKIGSTERIEYVEVSEISDTKASIKDKLVHTHDDGTSVEKVTQSELFEGLNLQEHILYLGHEDLLNIKGEVILTINVTNSHTASNLGNPDFVQWEYWGEAIRTEDGVEIEELDWHPLNIDLSKASISLQKTGWTDTKEQNWKSGEIKEYEINGIKSRWIRCKTKDIAKTKDVVLDIIKIGVQLSAPNGKRVVTQFDKLPPKAIRGVGKVFSKRLSEGFKTISGVNTIEELLKFKDRAEELAKILSGDEKPSKYYKEKAENILEYAEKRILDKEYEDMTNGDDNIQGILPDMAFYNDVPLDLTLDEDQELKTPIYPFGNVPRLYDTFYIASQECFSKKEEEIQILFSLEKEGEPQGDLILSWEYWNEMGWRAIEAIEGFKGEGGGEEIKEFKFQSDGGVRFTCPQDFQATEINGQKNYWIRVRIISGGYGKEETFEETGDKIWISITEVKAPKVRGLWIKIKDHKEWNLQHCLIYNNIEFKDVTEESKTGDKLFAPFQPLDDKHQTLYLGFDSKMEKGPISIFFSLEDQKFYVEEMPKIEWFYYSQDNKWLRLEVLDETRNLTRTGTVRFIVPAEFAKTAKFGDELYWLKAVDIEDKFRAQSAKVNGIYLNTTFAIQAESIEDEIIGSSDGSANQEFEITRSPVIGEKIWVKETGTLSEEEKEKYIKEKGEDSVLEEKDETWVQWQAVEDFFDSAAKSRHYVVVRATGEVMFGDGEYGMVPPIGRENIKASYQVGGGESGNVRVSVISTLKTSIPFVNRVTNPEAAEGGSDTELLESVFERGPHLIKHRDRAVTEEDFERLARSASSFIARTKCFTEGNKLKILLIPKGEEDEPMPSAGLLKTVETHLLDRSLNLILPASIEVQEPKYKKVEAAVDVVPESIDIAIPLEKEIVKRLKEFLHPLTGGPERKGWEFGRDVHISDVYALLEGINGVDHVVDLVLNYVLLFSIEDGALEKELKKGIIPERLEDMFKTKGIPLSLTATLTKESEDKWVITDEEKKYVIRKEGKKLNIYEESEDVEVKEDETVCSGEHRILMKLGGKIK